MEQGTSAASNSTTVNLVQPSTYNFEFPTKESFEFLKQILRLKPRETIPGVLPNKKQYLQKTFVYTSENSVESIQNQKSQKPLLIQEEAKDIILNVHNESHFGYHATYKKLKEHYHHVPFELIRSVLSQCDTCCRRKVNPLPPTGKPIIANGVMQRVQMDLIDMSHSADGDFKYILQVFQNIYWK